jgi:hypothetical protein
LANGRKNFVGNFRLGDYLDGNSLGSPLTQSGQQGLVAPRQKPGDRLGRCCLGVGRPMRSMPLAEGSVP